MEVGGRVLLVVLTLMQQITILLLIQMMEAALLLLVELQLQLMKLLAQGFFLLVFVVLINGQLAKQAVLDGCLQEILDLTLAQLQETTEQRENLLGQISQVQMQALFQKQKTLMFLDYLTQLLSLIILVIQELIHVPKTTFFMLKLMMEQHGILLWFYNLTLQGGTLIHTHLLDLIIVEVLKLDLEVKVVVSHVIT